MNNYNKTENHKKEIRKMLGLSSNGSPAIPKNKTAFDVAAERFYTANEEVTLRFYQTPKALFKNPVYKGQKCQNGISRDANKPLLDVPKSHPTNTYVNLPNLNNVKENVFSTNRKGSPEKGFFANDLCPGSKNIGKVLSKKI